MRVAFVSENVSPLVSPGVAETGRQSAHVAQLSAALARRGHDVVVYTRRQDLDAPDRVHADANFDVVHVSAGPAQPSSPDNHLAHMADFARYLRCQWQENPPDVVHAHYWSSGLMAQLAARTLGLTSLQTFHGLGSMKARVKGGSQRQYEHQIRTERVVAKAASRIIATHADEALELARMGTPRTRISVVPNGVDLNLFAPSDRVPSIEARESRMRRIVCVGPLEPRRGLDAVIKAVAVLPDVELIIPGGPPGCELDDYDEAQRLNRLAVEHGVANRVQLVGHVAHAAMPALLRTADVVICTPWYEPFAVLPVEAMACGIPVIAHGVDGHDDAIVDGVTGMLVPHGSPLRLVDCLREIFDHPSVAEGLGASGRDRAVARYSWDQIAIETERAYMRATPNVVGDRHVSAGQH
ncbi:glycosyltransferase [Hoyosella rhizosphaerae]|uniref:Glycosyl transferase n=1 Tax=Hoyosella rhizosphaerae TaxID=1755582 RepID=A0A916X8U2_9ACTN|nr:glycosyltransferase [Hoyosella rhizosphaerae]MBN4926929.1 glycosyltransferase [Hoyosella rhizosphaerae]GGC55403.1 glycosyl transferase [Hoyosella rhizosphaerae]